jgi:DMSO/TMAO reductase YedYZ molybdopterin-dependent catalytic subunit
MFKSVEGHMSEQEKDKNRRNLLKGGMLMGGFAMTGSVPFLSQSALAQGEEMVPFTDMPPDFTGPPKVGGGVFFQNTQNIEDFYSRNEDQFYVVQHYGQPQLNANNHRIRITGMVDNPITLSMADLRRYPKVEIAAAFECGGNNQGIYHGLIGNALWGGCRLRDVLRDAGVQNGGTEIVFYGADLGMETIRETQVEQSFARALHYNEAMHDDVMIAYEMNGEALPVYHGFPVRLLKPGWYGVANVKWLEQIHVQDRRFAGKYMARDYVTLSRRDIGGQMRWEERLVTRIQLKSAITRVTRQGNRHNITGFVLNDGTAIRSVEVKIDNGPWQEAQILSGSTRYSWKLFNFVWENASPGDHEIVSRVTDVNGQVQARPEDLPEKISRWENYGQFTRTLTIT